MKSWTDGVGKQCKTQVGNEETAKKALRCYKNIPSTDKKIRLSTLSKKIKSRKEDVVKVVKVMQRYDLVDFR